MISQSLTCTSLCSHFMTNIFPCAESNFKHLKLYDFNQIFRVVNGVFKRWWVLPKTIKFVFAAFLLSTKL